MTEGTVDNSVYLLNGTTSNKGEHFIWGSACEFSLERVVSKEEIKTARRELPKIKQFGTLRRALSIGNHSYKSYKTIKHRIH